MIRKSRQAVCDEIHKAKKILKETDMEVDKLYKKIEKLDKNRREIRDYILALHNQLAEIEKGGNYETVGNGNV